MDLTEQPEPEAPSMEGSRPAQPAEPGTLKVSLPETPGTPQLFIFFFFKVNVLLNITIALLLVFYIIRN